MYWQVTNQVFNLNIDAFYIILKIDCIRFNFRGILWTLFCQDV